MERISEIKGYWWLPEDIKKNLAGLLYTTEEGTHYLELFGSFEKPISSSRITEYEIINGISANGKYYTLSKAFIKSKFTNIPGFPRTTILVNIVFENLCAKTFEEIKFTNFYTTFLNLDDWILINGFNINTDNIKNQKIEYLQPEILKYNINNAFDLNINFIAYPPPSSIVKKEITIKQNIEFELVATDKSLEWFLDQVQILKYLLILLMNIPTKTLYLKGKILGGNQIVTIYFKENVELRPKDYLGIYDALVPFGKIKDKFADILDIWFTIYNIYQSSFILFFETAYHSKLNLENRFLNIVHSLESYHRKNINYTSSFMEQKTYLNTIFKELTKHIPSDLDDDFKNSLKSSN